MWRFIEEYLPNYSSRDDVLRDDILFSFVDDDDVSKEDLKWIEDEFKNDKKLVKEELVRLESHFMVEALKAYWSV